MKKNTLKYFKNFFLEKIYTNFQKFQKLKWMEKYEKI